MTKMDKKDKQLIIVVIIMVFLLLLFHNNYLSRGIGYDDYYSYDNEIATGTLIYNSKDVCIENWGIPSTCVQVQSETNKWTFNTKIGGTATATYESIESGKLKMTGFSSPKYHTSDDPTFSVFTKNIKDLNFKTSIEYYLPRGASQSTLLSGIAILVNGNYIFGESAPFSGLYTNTKDIEIYSSIFGDSIGVKVTGIPEKIIDVSGSNEVKLEVRALYNGYFYVVSPRFKTPYCEADSSQVEVIDRFDGTFDINSLSYTNLRFCLGNPPRIKNDDGVKTDYQGELFAMLVQGESITPSTLPFCAGSTICTATIPYITEYVAGANQRCTDLGTAWNQQAQQCEQIEQGPSIIPPPVQPSSLWSAIASVWITFWETIKQLFGI